MSPDAFLLKNEFYAITGAFNENSFNIFKFPHLPPRGSWSVTKAKATFILIIFAFLSKALVKRTKQKKKKY